MSIWVLGTELSTTFPSYRKGGIDFVKDLKPDLLFACIIYEGVSKRFGKRNENM